MQTNNSELMYAIREINCELQDNPEMVEVTMSRELFLMIVDSILVSDFRES